MFSDFDDTAEQVLARRYGRAQPEVHHGWEDVDAPRGVPLTEPYRDPAWRKALSDTASRRAPRALRRMRASAPPMPHKLTRKDKNKLSRAHKRMVATDIKMGRCESAFHGLTVLRTSKLPGAKKAAQVLGRKFTRKCLRVRCARSK